MSEQWSRSDDVVAWTEHDGPGRPQPGPSPRWYQGLAAGFAGWFALAVVGCELVHHSGTEHVPLSTAEIVGGVTVFLGLPAMAVLLARRSIVGPLLAVVLGLLATVVSATQWSVAPWYTAVEAGGFAILTVLAAVLAVRQLRSRHAGPVAVPRRLAESPVAAAPAEAPQPASR